MSNNLMVSVPREPTDEMIRNAMSVPVADTGNDDVDEPQDYRNLWKAMIDASPAQQHQGEPVTLPAKKYPKDWNKPALASCNMEYMDGYNTAIDDVAKLGPLYTRPAQGEPVAYLITPPGCSPALVFARDIRSVNAYTAPLYTHADPAEVERLRLGNKRLWTAYNDQQDKRLAAEDERNVARAQLAERDALIRRALFREADDGYIDAMTAREELRAALTASAEPCAATCGPGNPCAYPVSCGCQGATVERDELTRMVDAAMVEMSNIYPPLGRGECARLIRAALERKP